MKYRLLRASRRHAYKRPRQHTAKRPQRAPALRLYIVPPAAPAPAPAVRLYDTRCPPWATHILLTIDGKPAWTNFKRTGKEEWNLVSNDLPQIHEVLTKLGVVDLMAEAIARDWRSHVPRRGRGAPWGW